VWWSEGRLSPRERSCVIGIAVALLGGAVGASGQAGNYWTEQFGGQSMLLSGAVIGSVSDLGLVFYNPGRLGLMDRPDFVVAGKALQWERVRLRDGLGPGADLEDSSFRAAPSLAAGAFTLPFLPGHRFAYSFLTRRQADTDVFFRTERSGDILPGTPGEEFYAGTFQALRNSREDWIGLTWSHALGGHWGLGLSTFYYSLSQRDHLAMDLKVLTALGDIAALLRTRDVRFKDQGLIWKAGLGAVFRPVTVGITVTSPRLSLFASGRVQYEDLLDGLDDPNDPAAGHRLVTSVQQGLPAVTRSPWAVGAGAGVEWGEVTIHVAGEWYAAVPRYVVTETEPFAGQSTGELTGFRMVEELRSVLDGAVGVQWRHGDRLSLFASLATDRSAVPPERPSSLTFANEVSTAAYRADYVQAGAGILLSTRYFDLTFGVGFGWASDNVEKPVMLPEGGDLLPSPEDGARMEIARGRFLVGFTFPFMDEVGNAIR